MQTATVKVPQVSFTSHITAYDLDTWDLTAQSAYKQHIRDAIAGALCLHCMCQAGLAIRSLLICCCAAAGHIGTALSAL